MNKTRHDDTYTDGFTAIPGRPAHERVWLTWEHQRRNHTASAALGARLHELDYSNPAPIRYPRAIANTLRILRRQRPRLIFAQNPSIVLAALAVAYGKLSRTPVIVDAHNAGIRPFEGRKRWANRLTRHIIRGATATIVSNPGLAAYVSRRGGRPLLLPDPLPPLQRPSRPCLMSGGFKVLFICTWAEDEPYFEVLAAAERLPPAVKIYITGNSKGRERGYGAALPANVELTGFVSEADFTGLLYGADLVMDLTTRADCLLCGAYEAVAAGKPLLLSNSLALRSYFHSGARYTDNSAADIAGQIEAARQEYASLLAAVRGLRHELEQNWSEQRERILQQLAAIESAAR